MKKIIAIIFCICAVMATVFSIKYVNAPLNTIPAELITHEDSISTKGFIVRDEKVYYARNSGTVYNHASEGERVSKDMIISTVYSGVISKDTLKELSTLDKKIAKEQSLTESGTLSVTDGSTVENAIATYTGKIYKAARDKRIEDISSYKSDINDLRKNGELSTNDKLSEYNAQKQAIENRIGANKDEIFTDISGMFTTYLDGLESVLSPDKIKDYTVGYIENLIGSRDTYGTISGNVNTGDPICKVVNNHLWYVLVTVDGAYAESYKTGTTVKLRFKNITNEESVGTVSYVSEPENDKAIMLIKCPEYMESAFAYRDADVDVILKSYTGYKVPIQSVRTDNGKYSVLAKSGNKQFTCECNVLYSDTKDNIAIIQSTDTAQIKLSKMDSIITGER